ncbi:tetratricopeptide repeat protein 28-like [Oculina patagonica]
MGDRAGEKCAYGNLGNAYQVLSDFKQAIEYHEKCLNIAKEVGDRAGEGWAYGNLGNAYQGLGNFKQAIEYHEKDLSIAKEVGDWAEEGRAYGNLGNAYYGLGDFKQAIEYHKEHLSIAKKVGDRAGEGLAYGNLGNAFQGLGDFKQAIEYHKEHLSIAKKVGDWAGEGHAYSNLGNDYECLRDFKQANRYCKQGLKISEKTEDKDLEVCGYDLLGQIRLDLGDLEGCIEYCLQSLRIAEEVGDKQAEGVLYCKLGSAYRRRGDLEVSKEYLEQHLNISKEVGDKCGEGCACFKLGFYFESVGYLHEALDFYRSGVKVYNKVRDLLQDEDEWKVNFRHMNQHSYTALWNTLVRLSKTNEALCAAEQVRAQALMDLMKVRYGHELLSSEFRGVEQKIPNVAGSMSTQTVFVALEDNTINSWVLCQGSDVQFQQKLVEHGNAVSFIEKLRKDALKENQICGRSLDKARETLPPSNVSGQTAESPNCEANSLRLLYRSIIGPIESMLKSDEVIIVPEGPLCLTPFAALVNENERYLSESIRIRIIPSLTSLKLLEDCSESYHSNTEALLVGDPCLDEITNIFGEPKMPQLPHAKEEVEKIGEILNTAPLTGKEATKEEVLNRIASVALVHIAAHGNSETGEIALAPSNPARKGMILEENDYMLKIADVQSVRLRAKLVVLSCCHSGQGPVKAEGAVGIARAFLGAGARSVLVSLWAIDDEATMEFMKSFYQHMSDGNSASVSLNRAMKRLRESEKFSAVRYWAPFVLIGDDVTLDFAVLSGTCAEESAQQVPRNINAVNP